ncbi:tyrosine-type recombinase/integrase [Candidatus Methanoperedens nitratireducens]|uniref:Putative Tyrosine Recombinase Xerd n=1 Tax=Candidatus Methanoperedens nitratireducens TaxID=1392998 RepID=A0A284VMR7_9EURY|nr:tyrosine-type recombinase/integrase [Candidatus Methanoperedens nitroreducens]SNQ60554.1 putative Tyrosine Recombinase Xerd [Candidatus Methanoperedens nitroreducens]
MPDSVVPTKTRKKPDEYFTQSEIDSLMEHLDNLMVPTLCKAFLRDRDKLLISLLWNTGLRISDALNIKLDNIDLKNESLTFQIRKRSKVIDRSISLDRALLYEIIKYRDTWRISSLLFDMSRDNFDKRLKGYCEGIGIKPKSAQKLRKGMAMRLHGKVPKEIIAYRLGRSGIQTGDEAYTKITPEIEKRFLKEVK